MHELWRSDYAVQVAHERAVQARARTRPLVDDVADAVDRRPLERARWLAVQMRSLLALVAVVE